MSAVRPVFRDGARLTAGQLNATVKYLRDSLRRFSLAPFSPGVAAGLTITASGSTFTINPGVAVDGRGRLLVLETPLVYTLAVSGDLFLTSGGPPVAHFVPGATTLFVVRLEYRESGGTTDTLCEAGSTFGVQEGVRATFELADDRETSTEAFLQLFNEGCVEPWSDLDGVSTGSCAVQLGTVALIAEPPLLASMFFRQGMSARLSLLRNSFGTPSMALGRLPVGSAQIDAVYFPVPTGGALLQSTHVSPFGAGYAAGRFSPKNNRAFEFAGGDGILPAERSGIAAIPCRFSSSNGAVAGAGVLLELFAAESGGGVVTVRRPAFIPGQVIGLSAGPAYTTVDGADVVVPVVVAGLLQASVQVGPSAAAPAGTDLFAPDAVSLTPVDGPGRLVVARLAEDRAASTSGQAYVWAVHPPTRSSLLKRADAMCDVTYIQASGAARRVHAAELADLGTYPFVALSGRHTSRVALARVAVDAFAIDVTGCGG